MKNIFLIGMMGCGKTETGKQLARELDWIFIDLDHEIEKRTGMSVNEIFESRGERYFRDVEKKLLKEFAQKRGQVVSTGGGVILDQENVSLMKSRGFTVYLEASMENLWSRVQHKTDRPLLKVSNPREAFLRIFQERLPLYQAASDHTIVTDWKDARQVTREILERLGLAKAS